MLWWLFIVTFKVQCTHRLTSRQRVSKAGRPWAPRHVLCRFKPSIEYTHCPYRRQSAQPQVSSPPKAHLWQRRKSPSFAVKYTRNPAAPAFERTSNRSRSPYGATNPHLRYNDHIPFFPRFLARHPVPSSPRPLRLNCITPFRVTYPSQWRPSISPRTGHRSRAATRPWSMLPFRALARRPTAIGLSSRSRLLSSTHFKIPVPKRAS